MGYWWSLVDLVGLFRRHCAERGVDHDHYDRRIAACRYSVAMDCRRYFAKIGNREAYDGAVAIADSFAFPSN